MIINSRVIIIVMISMLVLVVSKIVSKNSRLFSDRAMVSDFAQYAYWNTFESKNLEFKNSAETEAKPIQYRGDAFHNAVFNVASVHFNLEKSWQVDGFNVGIHSASKASIVADQQNVYFGTDSSWFYCYSRDGKFLWRVYLAKASRGIHSTAAVDQDSVYVGSYRGALYAIDKKSGTIRWRVTLGDTIGASPLLVDGKIVVAVELFPANGILVMLSAQSGRIIWQSSLLGEQAHSSPTLSSDGKSILLGVNNSTVQSFSVEDGSRIWQTSVKGPVKSTIAVVDDRAFVTSWGGSVVAINTSNGEKIWEYLDLRDSQVSPAVLKKANTLVVADISGSVIGLDLENGSFKWMIKSRYRQKSSPITITDGKSEKILMVCQRRKLCQISEKGIIEKRWDIPGYFTGSPLISEQALYLSMDTGQVAAWRFSEIKNKKLVR